jgi:hypothetical protein
MTDRAASTRTDVTSLLRLRTPTDLVEAIPYLLGFHPTESLVVVFLHGSRDRVGVTLRYELPCIGAVGALAHEVAAHAAMHGPDRLVFLIFTDQPRVAAGLPEWPLVSELLAALGQDAVVVADAFYVSGGRWWSYLCVDPHCCPPEGHALPAASAASELAAAAARAGLIALPDRAAVGRMLEPVDGRAQENMEQALADAEGSFIGAVAAAGGVPAWRAAMQAKIWRVLERMPTDGDRLVTDAECAEILVALSDIPIRDACWLAAEQERRDTAMALWSRLVRRSVPPYDAAPLFLLGWAAWRRGDGVLARMAAERALVSDPDYRAASLLLDAMNSGVDPRWIPSLAETPDGSGRTEDGRQQR